MKQEVLAPDASPEVVAYHLMFHVMEAEGRSSTSEGALRGKVTRKLMLDVYAECLEAVRGARTLRTASRTPI